jgi:hypothetical protein
MASFGNVLDLLDERYLDLVHDVVGNVEPTPTLVPYQDYVADVLVLRMDTNDKLFTALLHDFTARVAKETRKEIWTWCVQWEVDTDEASQLSAAAPSLKKPRLEIDEAVTKPTVQSPLPREPVIEIERRVIGADLMEEEDMLRVLIDIVQADSSKVPNYIEFLYRWIDYYEGDGTALKAALRCEIPSLWDFEYHPIILPTDVKGELNKDQSVENGDEKNATSANTSLIQDLIQRSPTKKMREKPDLAVFERQTEDSDRLQYREVRYGMQPPRLTLPLPPLINIPRHPVQRIKYYAACFKSRQRALIILMEADLTMRQISNYRVGQKEHPRDTPEDPNDNNPKDLKGLQSYYKDAEAAQSINILKEKMRLHREKQNEVAISSKLAVEARIAAATGMHEGASGVPLIPPTPSYARTPEMAADMLSRIKAAKFEGEERINFVPAPLVGRLKSRLFEGARESNQRLPQPSPCPSEGWMTLDPDHDEEMNMDEDAEGETVEEIDAEDSSEDDDAESDDEEDSEEDDDDDPDEHPTPFSLQPADAHHSKAMTTMGVQYQMPANAFQGASHNGSPVMHQRQSAQPTFGFMNGTPSGGQPMVAGQPRSASMPGLPPPPIRPPTFAILPPTYPGGPSTGPNMQYAGQRFASLPSPGLPPAPSYHHAPPTNFSSVQASPYNSSAPPGLQMPSQLAATQQGFLRPLAMQPLPASHFPPLLGAPNLVAPAHASRSPNGAFGFYGAASQRSNIGSMLPPPTPNSFANSGPSSALSQQQAALTPRAPLTPEEVELRNYMSRPFALQPLQRAAPPLITVTPSPAHGFQHMDIGPLPPPSRPMLSPPRPGIQRNAPAPLSIAPQLTSPSPFTSLGPSLLATTPFAAKPTGINIQIYIPRVIVPGNGVGPGGQRLGNDGITETDALMIGHTHPGSGKIILTKAIFMPVGVWANTLNRVQREQASMLETYSPHPNHPGLKNKQMIGKGTGTIGKGVCHAAIYSKLQTAYNLMRAPSARAREQQLTKRWRASKGPMTQRDRGAVWEGCGVTLDKGIEMSKADREGAYVWSWIVDEGTHKKVNLTEEEREHEKRMRELEEWESMEAEEGVDLEELYGPEGGDEMET